MRGKEGERDSRGKESAFIEAYYLKEFYLGIEFPYFSDSSSVSTPAAKIILNENSSIGSIFIILSKQKVF